MGKFFNDNLMNKNFRPRKALVNMPRARVQPESKLEAIPLEEAQERVSFSLKRTVEKK
jgi:hypothetical protein